MASYRYERDIKPEDLIQETPPPLTPAQQRANWWHYHWYYVVLIAAALLAVGYFVWNRVTEVQPDYTVAVVSRTDPDTAFLSQLETQLAGSPCRGRERRWQGESHGKGHLACTGL